MLDHKIVAGGHSTPGAKIESYSLAALLLFTGGYGVIASLLALLADTHETDPGCYLLVSLCFLALGLRQLSASRAHTDF